MIKEDLPIEQSYYSLSRAILKELHDLEKFKSDKFVIGICGESGSGKSVTARCLKKELAVQNIKAVVLNQDGFYLLSPKENSKRRKIEKDWIGPVEVDFPAIQKTMTDFRIGNAMIEVSVVDYLLDSFSKVEVSTQDVKVLIVEGTFAFKLDQLDYKIFIDRTYKDTFEVRAARSREVYDPFVEEVLEIEHQFVSPLKKDADIIIDNSYSIMKTQMKVD